MNYHRIFYMRNLTRATSKTWAPLPFRGTWVHLLVLVGLCIVCCDNLYVLFWPLHCLFLELRLLCYHFDIFKLFIQKKRSNKRLWTRIPTNIVLHFFWGEGGSSFCNLCTLCFQFFWIVHFWLPLHYSLTKQPVMSPVLHI